MQIITFEIFDINQEYSLRKSQYFNCLPVLFSRFSCILIDSPEIRNLGTS